MITRTRIIKQDRFWDIFQEFVDAGLIMTELENSLGLGRGYLRSVKSKRRIPKYSTYKDICDELRFRSGKRVKNVLNTAYPTITSDDLDFILDPVFIRRELEKRNCTIVSLAKLINTKDHTLAERIRYWKDRPVQNMRLETLRDLETAFRKYDEDALLQRSYDDDEPKFTWDFRKERQEFLKTGVMRSSLGRDVD